MAASEQVRHKLERHLPTRAEVEDPANRLVLRPSVRRTLSTSAAAGAFILVFGGVLIRLVLLGHAPSIGEVLFALLCFAMALVGVVAMAQTIAGRLELTADGLHSAPAAECQLTRARARGARRTARADVTSGSDRR